MKKALPPEIVSRQVELLFRNQSSGQAVSLLVASYMAWIGFQEGIPRSQIAAWWIAAVTISSLRLLHAQLYAKASQEDKFSRLTIWLRRVRLGALGSGLIWGAGAGLMIFDRELSLQLFTAFVMAGMSAGAVPVLCADRLSYLFYAWPIVGTVIVGVAGIDHMHTAFMAVSVLALTIFTRSADIFYKMLLETFALEHEKGMLLASVEQARHSAERSDRAKTEFLANISHELRTPINGIIGLAELMNQEQLTPDQRALLQPLQESADTLSRQIDQLIELSALEAGHVTVKPAPFAVSDLLLGMLSNQRKAAEAKALELQCEEDPELPPILIGDLDRLHEIFDLLVGNAIKFTDRGSVRISAKLAGYEGALSRITFSITDTGVGISAEKRQQLESLFATGDNSLIRRHSGIGVGLRIARRLVELMGGTLHIESEEGVGSCFSFTLPFRRDGFQPVIIPSSK